MEVDRRLEQAVRLCRGERAAHDAVRLVLVRQPVLRELVARLWLCLVPRPLPQRQDRLLRLVDDLLAELDRLGQDDLFLGVEQRHLADLLEVHPDRVVDADHVGRDRVQLLGGRLFGHLGVELGRRLFPRRLVRVVEGNLDAKLAGYGQTVVGRLVQLVLGLSRVVVVAPALAALEHAGHELLVTYIHLGSASCCAGCGRGLCLSFLA